MSTQLTTLASRFPAFPMSLVTALLFAESTVSWSAYINHCPPSLTKSCLLCNCYSRDAIAACGQHITHPNRISDVLIQCCSDVSIFQHSNSYHTILITLIIIYYYVNSIIFKILDCILITVQNNLS